MKVILQQEVKNLGKKGEIKEVSEGYARNYLLPQKLAVAATATNVNTATQQKEAELQKAKRLVDEAKVLAAQLSKLEAKVPVKTGEGGRLFGSVTSKDIADALAVPTWCGWISAKSSSRIPSKHWGLIRLLLSCIPKSVHKFKCR